MADQTRPGNLMTLHVIDCLACYDLGEVINPFDHSERTPCGCQAGQPETPPPNWWQRIREMAQAEFYRPYFWRL